MLTTIFSFITAALGFLCTAFILRKNNNHERSLINKYLIVITSITALRYFSHGVSGAFPSDAIINLSTALDVSIIMLMPCFYLYFQNIINEMKFKPAHILHFVAPLVVVVAFIITKAAASEHLLQCRKLFFIVCAVLYSIYAIAGFSLLYRHIWHRKTDINVVQKQNILIKNWTIFLYISFLMLLIIRVITSLMSDTPGSFSNNYLWLPALVWIGIFVKIILTPEILYGYDFLNKTIHEVTNKVVLNSVWLTESTLIPITSEKDKKLEEKITPLLMEYLHRIEELSFHTVTFRNPELSLNDISVALNLPISHVNFVFKYHCNESFTDYKKIVRIHDATKLLEGGYLNNQKVESLSATVGFSSYNTFNVAFKSIMGVTTQEYIKRF
jgi:hypothetical protein